MNNTEKCVTLRALIAAFKQDAYEEKVGDVEVARDCHAGRSIAYANRLLQMVQSLED
jgi:hypothetical protein